MLSSIPRRQNLVELLYLPQRSVYQLNSILPLDKTLSTKDQKNLLFLLTPLKRMHLTQVKNKNPTNKILAKSKVGKETKKTKQKITLIYPHKMSAF